MKPTKKPFDPVVKLGLGVLIGSFLLIFVGMYLSRPDRSIPPYSIGSQEGTVVAVHVPAWTSDPEIETLIRRFRKVGRETRDFGSLKIRPTTPHDPSNLYQRMTMYIFSDHNWTKPEMLHRYLTPDSDGSEDVFKRDFELTARGGYRLDQSEEMGWLGPIDPHGTTSSSTYVLFQGPFNEANSVSTTEVIPAEG